MTETRIETDSMGEVEVPAERLYGAQTQRALENFPLSGLRFGRRFLHALGAIKWAAARANADLGLLDERLAEPIGHAALEVSRGALDDEFVIDVFQTGSGTSTNMNANEVIGNRANQLLGGEPGSRSPVHPNDHVNMSQSSNDVIPTTIHVAAATAILEDLLPALGRLHDALLEKSRAFANVVKIGRTHLQDAVPVTLGQVFGGYASQIAHGIGRVERVLPDLAELAIGGTAVGTGLNGHPEFAGRAIAHLNEHLELPAGREFTAAANRFEALAARDAAVDASGACRTVAVGLMKIANDLRLLSSGPRCGIGEIRLPALQPGSSIMPGKVNPVVPEALCQIAAQVIGNDVTITVGGQAGQLELNVMKPVIAYNLLQSIHILATGSDLLASRCVAGIEADEERCRAMIEGSLAMVTALTPKIGYDAAARIAKESHEMGRPVREIAEERGVLPPDELARILDPIRMTRPGIPE